MKREPDESPEHAHELPSDRPRPVILAAVGQPVVKAKGSPDILSATLLNMAQSLIPPEVFDQVYLEFYTRTPWQAILFECDGAQLGKHFYNT